MKAAQISEAGGSFELIDTLPEVETYPLEQVNEAYDRMINNEVWFRVVLQP